ncbi:MAG TPA: hypothetical protein VH678_13155 [Xanthobacteraceae bacterium]|jgi:hypothetical protein
MKPRQPSRPEPEIILPGDPEPRSSRAASGFRGAYPFVDVRAIHRVYTARLGPFGLILLALGVAIVAAVVLILLLGAVLFWIPVIILLAVAAMISGLLRR